jgi:hypothetical protein
MKNRDKDVGIKRNFKTYFKLFFQNKIRENELVAELTQNSAISSAI